MHIILLLLIGSVILDGFARPRVLLLPYLRRFSGYFLLWVIALVLFGGVLAISSNPIISVLIVLIIISVFSVVSNAKFAMLGEPLVFSDLALIGAVFRHPQFYLSALTPVQKAALVLLAPVLAAALWWLSRFDPLMHVTGFAILLGSLLLLALSLKLWLPAYTLDVAGHQDDVARYGLLPSLLLYWSYWRQSVDPLPPAPIATCPANGEVVVLVQCESFADPVELFLDDRLQLPGLHAARKQAWQWGALNVSGFGAYTMRTEYGVLFGRSDNDLGFRRFDPFLTAIREAGFALPARLKPGWRSLFIHPHDLRFYNRTEIMRAAGFATLIGPEDFERPTLRDGRYVTDAAIGKKIIELAREASVPTLIYAVTIENHGPWGASQDERNSMESYVRLVRKGDAMLQNLIDGLAQLERPATLVYFGDHRPSIPCLVTPGGDNHTPYVITRFDAKGDTIQGHSCRVDLTPAELHHTLLDLLRRS